MTASTTSADPVGLGRFVVVPASYVFCLRPGADGGLPEVLLQLRSGTGYMDDHWAAGAAGHVEKGETAYDAAAREAREELGITDARLEFVATMQRTSPVDRPALAIDERVDFFFATSAWSGEPRIMEGAKCADLRWFGLGALPEPVVPHERKVLGVLRASIEAGADRPAGGVGTLGHSPAPYLTYGYDEHEENR